MKKKLKQILKNQTTILAVLRILSEERSLDGFTGALNRRREETKKLLMSEMIKK